MTAVVIQHPESFRVPEWVIDLNSFNRWLEEPDFPEEGRIDFLQGEIWIDMSEEEVWSHNQAKAEFTVVLGGLAKAERRGRFFPAGFRFQHPEAELSVVPDGVFICNDTFQTMRVTLAQGSAGTDMRVVGSPNMVLEVISASSVGKDTQRLRELYWKAGVREYWLVDARKQGLTFTILRHTARGFVATPSRDGWLKSAVFGKSFRLTRAADELDHPTFALELR